MKKVDQTVIADKVGDCVRAVVASMFELDISQVPSFMLFGEKWWSVYWHFLLSIGYEYLSSETIKNPPTENDLINGCIDASVKSKTFENATHAVLIDVNGVVIHDPNPNKAWLGINIIVTGDLRLWFRIRKVENKETNDDPASVSSSQ